ncbi:hypothetical protein ABPG77_005068 [Micractinium sp. CCAP 211/92]
MAASSHLLLADSKCLESQATRLGVAKLAARQTLRAAGRSGPPTKLAKDAAGASDCCPQAALLESRPLLEHLFFSRPTVWWIVPAHGTAKRQHLLPPCDHLQLSRLPVCQP